ncbi:MAG: molybdenum cofactor guanylyltransferase MobA [Roseivirga sp.]
MGEDKGLVLLKNKPMITYAIETLKPLVSEILIMANSSSYDHFGLKVYPDLKPGCGPLGGIFTGLTHSQTDWNLVLSCDTPFVTTELLAHLQSKAGAQKAILPVHKEQVEPLVGLYHKSCRIIFGELIQRKEFKMRYAVKRLKPLKLTVDERNDFYSKRLFDNINTPEALEQAGKALDSN